MSEVILLKKLFPTELTLAQEQQLMDIYMTGGCNCHRRPAGDEPAIRHSRKRPKPNILERGLS